MKRFSDIIGQDDVISHLRRALFQHQLSHAYLLNGENGSGKNLIADVFSAALQCEATAAARTPEEIQPCGVCKSCLQAASGNQPDIIRVTHEKASIGVDDIREQLNGDIQIKPYRGPYKLYIIDEAEKMTEAAQNALLKTIEEPPAYAVILLLTENAGGMLPTVLSRCVQLQMKPIPQGVIAEYLKTERQIPEYQAELAAAFSGGVLGKAIRFASSEAFEQQKEMVLHLLRFLPQMQTSELVDIGKQFADYKKEIDNCLDLMLLWYRDVLMFKATQNANGVVFRAELSEITKQASRMSFSGLEEVLQALRKASVRLKANVNFDLTLELLMLTIKENS